MITSLIRKGDQDGASSVRVRWWKLWKAGRQSSRRHVAELASRVYSHRPLEGICWPVTEGFEEGQMISFVQPHRCLMLSQYNQESQPLIGSTDRLLKEDDSERL